MTTEPLQIEIVSDVVCPWCYIGKRHIEAALARYARERPDAPAPRVTWLPFQLNPQLPPEGMDRLAYIEWKFGPGEGHGRYARVAAVGREAGIAFAFERIVRQPNTVAPHSLIELAQRAGRQDEVVEALFRAYFLDGRDLTSPAALIEIAVAAGLDEGAVRAQLADAGAAEAVRALEREARTWGVEGVPFFVFNRRHAASGAQPPEALLHTMLAAEAPAGIEVTAR